MAAEAVTLRPDPARWRTIITGARVPPATAADRAAVGLPADRPVVLSGHQPTLWHAGILAKLLAACELAAATGAAAGWIVPDADESDPTTARVPEGRGESATARVVRLLAGDPPGPGVPPGVLPPRDPAPADPRLPGLAAALAGFREEPSLAMQSARATIRLACSRFGLAEPVVFSATDLCRTGAWAALLDAIAADPEGCAAAYNAAAGAEPDARVRALLVGPGRIELPLWRVRPGLPRLPVFSDQIDALPRAELRPRALAMTAVARAALGDLFIHGLGGERYDRVTEAWLDGWSLAPGWFLAPTAVATADAYPDLGIDAARLPDPARAKWLAHHARHDPALLGDAPAAALKDAMLGRIRAMKDAGTDSAPAFAELQALLASYRDRHADALADLAADAARAERSRAVRELALDRTWPWPVLPDATLDALHAKVRSALAGAKMSRCANACSCSS